MNIRDFDFDLPPELIAQRPAARRDDSRMMVVERATGRISHRAFRDFPDLLRGDELLVLNDAKVIPAKAWGKRGAAAVEFLFLKEVGPGLWDALCKPARRVRPGDEVVFSDDLRGTAEPFQAEDGGQEGRRRLRFAVPDVLGRLKKVGFAPLPPYIKRAKGDLADRERDLERYQTVFAAREGAIAAPTAGLHFTPEVLERIRAKGVESARVTLHVGLATFQPMRTERIEDHRMLEEFYEVPAAVAEAVFRSKAAGRSIVAVGTTVVRTLESAGRSGRVQAGPGATSLFITPGFEFKIVDRLLTNFHLPRSTLLLLVSALAGRDLILGAYREAVKERYRFFSYGDCMLIK
jgi:S-adenosylmethionine:tRNA ribosyltransferase-isomerase